MIRTTTLLAIYMAAQCTPTAVQARTSRHAARILVIGGYDSIPGAIEKHIAEDCPDIFAITRSASEADYVFRAAQRNSILEKSSGGVLYRTPALWAKNMAKDVCTFAREHGL